MKLAEIADRISAHLSRFESDPKINIVGEGRLKSDALAYLAWLDDGNVGKHYRALGVR